MCVCVCVSMQDELNWLKKDLVFRERGRIILGTAIQLWDVICGLLFLSGFRLWGLKLGSSHESSPASNWLSKLLDQLLWRKTVGIGGMPGGCKKKWRSKEFLLFSICFVAVWILGLCFLVLGAVDLVTVSQQSFLSISYQVFLLSVINQILYARNSRTNRITEFQKHSSLFCSSIIG